MIKKERTTIEKIIQPILLFILLLSFIQISFAVDTMNGLLIKTKWGDTHAHWAKFEYFEDGKPKSTPLYWYKNFKIQVSKTNITEEYCELNATYTTMIKETNTQIKIIRNIKEYKYKPFTEVTVFSKSNRSLATMYPNFLILAKGKYLLAPGIVEPATTKVGDGTDGKWPVIIYYGKTDDNYALIFTPGKTTTLMITNKRFGMTSWDKGDYWMWYFCIWRFSNVQPNKIYTYKYWLTPIYISKNDTMLNIKEKASDLAHEALVKPIKIYEKKIRGYDFWLYEVWYKFKYEQNDWNINPFKLSPHDFKGRLVNDTCLAAIYLPKYAIAVRGPEGYPAVFNDGRPAIGLYFKYSINGNRGEDLWFGNASCGGGFYLKKFDPTKEIVKVYYAIPAEPLIKNYPVKIKSLNLTNETKLIVANKSYFTFIDQIFFITLSFTIIFAFTLLLLLLDKLKKTKMIYLLVSIIPLFASLIYTLYHFHSNPLRYYDFYLMVLIYSLIISTIFLYKTKVTWKLRMTMITLTIATVTLVILTFFNPYLIPAIAISVISTLIEAKRELIKNAYK